MGIVAFRGLGGKLSSDSMETMRSAVSSQPTQKSREDDWHRRLGVFAHLNLVDAVSVVAI